MEDTTAALHAAEVLVAALKSTPLATTPSTHLTLLKLADKVRAALTTPYDIITRHIEDLSLAGVMESLVSTGAVENVPPQGSITASALAASINIDTSTLQRLMRLAICNGIFTETAPDTYAHNPQSAAYLPSVLGNMFLLSMQQTAHTTPFLPKYLSTHSPSDIFDLKKSPYVYARGKEGLTYFECLDEDEEYRAKWDVGMAAMEKNMPISGMFPFGEMKEAVEREPERVFVVDVAGGRGQALLKLREEIPGVFGGRLVLQDLPVVVDGLGDGELEGIERMGYDIFGEQPVRNAHIYFFRRILHDFYNEPCVEILKNTAKAMGPDSRLIVCDMIVPEMVEVNGPQEVYWLDFNLMLIGGKEKTLKEFKEIFDAAGLELVKVYPSGIGATVQLETRLKRVG